jgi:hypothetical protein
VPKPLTARTSTDYTTSIGLSTMGAECRFGSRATCSESLSTGGARQGRRAPQSSMPTGVNSTPRKRRLRFP